MTTSPDAVRCVCPVLDLSHIPDPTLEWPFLRGYDPDCDIHGVIGTNPDEIHPSYWRRSE